MAKRLGLVVLTLVSAALWLAPAAGMQQAESDTYVPGEVIVRFAPGVSSTRKGSFMNARAATITRHLAELGLETVRLPPGRTVAAAVAELRTNPEIVLAQPNFVYQAVAPPPPNDPQWLNNALWGLQKIAAQQTWQAFGSGNGSVIVADIDTGVSYTHPDLAANMWQNPGEIAGNLQDDDSNGYIDDVFGIDTVNHDSNPADDHGHGTHTSGTIAAVGNNGIGVVGVNWNAKILACKFLNAAGKGSDAGAIECLNYIIALKNRGENIRVSNNSWGSYRGQTISQALKDAFDAAGGVGIVNVCAAGNDNTNTDTSPFDPASFTSSSIVSVAASDGSDNRASFSNYGVTSVDLAAPGVAIRSTVPGNAYGDSDGTSMAAPHVAGVVALLASLVPSLTVDNLKVLLTQNVDVLPQWGGVVASGGRLNSFKAATASGAASARINVALAANGGLATASSIHSSAYAAAGAINGDRRGQPWGNNAGWNDGTSNIWPDWLEVSFSSTRTIDEINVFSVQDSYKSPSDPTVGMTFTLYGLRNFEVQYWTGAAWVAVPGGLITNNSLVWRQVLFAPVTTSKIRVWVTTTPDTWSRIAEVEAWTSAGGGPVNTPPTVTLTAPATGTPFAAGDTIALAANAGDSDGTVASVAFYANGTLLGTDTTNPYAWSWPNVGAGTYALTAIATDDDNATTTSNVATVTVAPVAPPPPPPGRINAALAANGGTATASSIHSSAYAAAGAINGDRRGQPWGNNAGWNDGTSNIWPDWLEVSFSSTRTIDEINVFSVQDSYKSPSDPTVGMTFTLYGLRNFEVQYWTGAAWVAVPGGLITNNSLVWRQVIFAPVTTSKIRVWVTTTPDTWSRIAEVEAWTSAGGGPVNTPPTVTLTAPATGTPFAAGDTIALAANAGDSDGTVASVAFYANGTLLGTDTTNPYAWSWPNVGAGTYALTAIATDDDNATTTSNVATVTVTPVAPPPPPPGRINAALAANGGTATASSIHSSAYGASGAINGDRRGQPWGNNAGWNDGTSNIWPDWLEVSFSSTRTIDEINVFSVQDSYKSPSDPTVGMTFTLYGLRNFEVQYWTGAAWVAVPGGLITNNSLVWRQVLFAPVTTSKIRVWVTTTPDTWSRIAEVEAWTSAGGAPVNTPPTVTLAAPAHGASYTAGDTIALTANAGDSDGTVSSVAFYANGTLLGTDTTNPYAWSWPNVVTGTYVLTAVATDDDNATTTSNTATVTVTPVAPMNPPATVPSTITLRADFVGTIGPDENATSPIAAGPHLLMLRQLYRLYRWDGTTGQEILSRPTAPAGIIPIGDEAILNVAANVTGTSVFVMFTSTLAPAGIPAYTSPRPNANAWQVLYRYDFNGIALSNPQAIVAFQVYMYGHTGGGMVVLGDGTVLFATGDNGDAGEDGRQYAQDVSNHLSKILRIDPATSAVTVLAVGVRNVQRLFMNPNSGDPRLEFVDLGGSIAEEFNSVRLIDLLAAPVENFGWGRNASDNLAREGTFYIDSNGAATGAAPKPETGFQQPVAQFGREGAPLVAVSGSVSSTASFTNITALFGDLPTGNVMAVIGVPGTPGQTVYRVNLVDSSLAPVTLAGLAGGRPDVRFFLFPDGTAGVLLERTGVFYRLTQIGQ